MKKPSPNECRDTALALSFLCLLIFLFNHSLVLIYIAMAILLLGMTVPKAMKYPAIAWFGLAAVLHSVVSRVVLGIAFFLIVLPMAMIMKLIGKDPMGLKKWKQGSQSAFVFRRQRFAKEDLYRQF